MSLINITNANLGKIAMYFTRIHGQVNFSNDNVEKSTQEIMLFFSTGSYRSRDEVQSVRKTRDPILGLREKLLDSGLADTEDIKVLQCVY